MLNTEFKTIRIRAGYTQREFAELLGTNVDRIQSYENDFYSVPPSVEATLDKILIKETETILTDMVFSKRLFLKHMLTGNKVVDDIYKNAKWLDYYDRKPVQARATVTLLSRESKNKEKKTIQVRKANRQYIIIGKANKVFICKKEWLL